jgi:hypothetical protein
MVKKCCSLGQITPSTVVAADWILMHNSLLGNLAGSQRMFRRPCLTHQAGNHPSSRRKVEMFQCRTSGGKRTDWNANTKSYAQRIISR